MKNKASIVIIGGGITGCATAYYLAEKGYKDVVLLEKSFLSSGATGRCGAGVRQQWGTRQNCFLARESMRVFENLNDILKTKRDVELKQKGYLLLAFSEKEKEQFKRNIEVQHELNIPSKLVSPREAREIVPMLNTDDVVCGAFCPTDGHLNPFLTTIAYAEAAENLGVEINKGVTVNSIETINGLIKGVHTDKGFIETDKVLNAAGGWAQDVGKMVGLDLPVFSERHEILVTEPVEAVLDPMVMSFSYNIYCQQSPHGSFIMGYGPKNEPHGKNTRSSHQFLYEMAKKVTGILPATKNLRVVRQWAGMYNISPDRQPIVCESESVKGFYMAIGFSGHGFMLAPAIGMYMSDIIINGESCYDLTLDLGRFDREESIAEPSVV